MTQMPFIFADEIESRVGDRVLRLPPDVSNREALFAALADRLGFPAYFGENWDAFEECLRDLSWLPPGRVILSHPDIPLTADPANARMYVAILGDAVRTMSKSKDRELVVLFPSASREQIEWLLRSRRARE